MLGESCWRSSSSVAVKRSAAEVGCLICQSFPFTHTEIYKYYTLTGHFIRYTLLVPGCTPFCLHSSWHRFNKVLGHSSEILVHIDMTASHNCCRFVGCTSMKPISPSTTSQRCSIGLRSVDCGGHWSTLISLSCSKKQFEMICAL